MSLFLSAALAVFLTLLISDLGMNAILASSSLTCLFAGLVFFLGLRKDAAGAFFCGSFAGMSSIPFLPLTDFTAMIYLLILALITGLAVVLTDKTEQRFNNSDIFKFGGKLGTIAFVASFLTATLLGLTFHDGSLHDSDAFLLLSFVAGAVIPVLIRDSFQLFYQDHRVFVTSATALVIGFILIILSKDIYAAGFYAGTFVSMTSPLIFTKRRHYVFAGGLAFLFFDPLSNYFSALGGLLGFAAFCGVASFYMILKLVERLNFFVKNAQ